MPLSGVLSLLFRKIVTELQPFEIFGIFTLLARLWMRCRLPAEFHKILTRVMAPCKFWHFYAPNFEKVGGAYCFSVCLSVTFYVSCNFGTVHARVLKFHIWIPHCKIVDLFFSFPCCAPFWSYAPFNKWDGSLVNKISEKLFKLGKDWGWGIDYLINFWTNYGPLKYLAFFPC